MRILFTGGTGVIGRAAMPHLLDNGHDMAAVARTEEERTWLLQVGARPLELDLFDPDAVDQAVSGVEGVLHFATAIPPAKTIARRSAWNMNDRLRTESTRYLVEAALNHDVEVFVRESTAFAYADGGDHWLDEDARIDPPTPIVESGLIAERHVSEYTAAGGRGVALRLSHLYGPGRASADYLDAVARRRLPVIGRGRNWYSSLHTADAGTAVAAALRAPAGVYNVSDDEPVPAHLVVEALAAALGAPAPQHLPTWIAKPVLRAVYPLMTVSQRVSAERFKKVTGWQPSYASIVDGWHQVVSAPGTDTSAARISDGT